MKLIKLITVAVFVSLSLFSCNNEKQSGHGIDINIDEVANKQSKDPNASGDNKCLLAYADKYDQLLTEEMVLKATGFPKDKLKIKYSKVLKNNAHHSVSYAFNMGRIQKMPEMDMELKMPDNIKLKNIKAISTKQFEDSYRALTDEEQASFEQTKNDVLDGNAGGAEGEQALQQAKEKGMDKKQLEQGVSKLGAVFDKVRKAYVAIEGLADAATWNTFTREIIVLQNGVQFVLEVNVSADEEKNKTMAIALAKELLAQCN